jgi:predicted nuclease of predicted toxin-antitoxin system
VKFLLDHDVPSEVERVLIRAGHDVVTVRQVMSPTALDSEVLKHATEGSRVLVTCNRDDCLRESAAGAHPGIIILIRRKTRIAECAALIRLIQKAGDSGLSQNINFA